MGRVRLGRLQLQQLPLGLDTRHRTEYGSTGQDDTSWATPGVSWLIRAYEEDNVCDVHQG